MNATEQFIDDLDKSRLYFEQYHGTKDWSDGWKLSIQGTSLDDTAYLVDHLVPFMIESGASFKFATSRLIDSDIPQQKNKLLTVYIPNEYEVKEYAEKIHKLIPDYEGGKDVKHPTSYTHYKGSIYYRNDRDENGNYIVAHDEY